MRDAPQKQPAKITVKSAAATKSEPRFNQTGRRLHQGRIFTIREPQVRARQFEPLLVRVPQSNLQRAFNTFVAYATHRDGVEGFKQLWAAPTAAAATVLGLFAFLILLDEHLGMRRMLAVAPLSGVNDVVGYAEGWIKKAPEAPFVEDNSQTTLFGPATKQATTQPKDASLGSMKETSGASVSPDPSVASSEAVAESAPTVREQIPVLPPPALEDAGVRGRVSREESGQARIEVIQPRTEVIQPRAEVAKAAPRERVDPVPERSGSALATAIDKMKVLIEEKKSAAIDKMKLLIEEKKSAFLSNDKKTGTSELPQERGAAGAKEASSQGAFAEDNPAINLGSAKKLSSQPSTIISNKSGTPTREKADVSQREQGSITQGTVHEDGGHAAAPGNARRTESQVVRNAEIKRDEPGNTAGVAPITSIIERVAESESVKNAERRTEPGTSERGTTQRAEAPATVAPVERVGTSTIVTPVVRVEVPAEVTPVKRVDRPVAATPGERVETPAAVAPVQRVETPGTGTPVQRVETPAIVAPVERVETVAPVERVKVPMAVAPVERIETPVIVAPVDRVEVPAAVVPVERVETPTVVTPMQRVETPLTVTPVQRVETPAAVTPVQRVELPTIVAPVQRVERPVAVQTIQRIERPQVAEVPQRVERPLVERAPVQRPETVERSGKAEKPDRPNKPQRLDRPQHGKR